MIERLKIDPYDDIAILELIDNRSTFETGFTSLVKAYKERVYWHIRRMVLDHEDADDVAQEVFIKIFKSIDRFEKKSSLYTWIYRITTNETLTFLKRKKRYMTSALEDVDGIGETLRADKYFDGDEAQLKLQKALLLLPSKQKLVFNMRYFDDMPYEEISNVLGTSVGALKASYHHAVKKVESYIKNEPHV